MDYEELVSCDDCHSLYKRLYILEDKAHLCSFEYFKKYIYPTYNNEIVF